MSSRERLFVRVNRDLVLDAGGCAHGEGPDGPARVIHPPRTILFRQVLDYLQAKPDPEKRPAGSGGGREGIAAAAVTLRWGSYFCVLADRNMPLCGAVSSPAVSRISDEEMARIDIEASAALAEWIDLHRADPSRVGSLVERRQAAVDATAPWTQRTGRLPQGVSRGSFLAPMSLQRFLRRACRMVQSASRSR